MLGRTPIPENIDDTSKGIMIDLSEEDVESIKAQLSIDHYKDLLNLDMAKELNDNVKIYKVQLIHPLLVFPMDLMIMLSFLVII